MGPRVVPTKLAIEGPIREAAHSLQCLDSDSRAAGMEMEGSEKECDSTQPNDLASISQFSDVVFHGSRAALPWLDDLAFAAGGSAGVDFRNGAALTRFYRCESLRKLRRSGQPSIQYAVGMEKARPWIPGDS